MAPGVEGAALRHRRRVFVTAGNGGDGAPADAAPQAEPSLAPPPDGGPMPTPVDSAGNGFPAGLELGGSIAERKVLESLSGRRRELARAPGGWMDALLTDQYVVDMSCV